MGEIRLQWWRDALEAPHTATRTGNPIADAVRDAAHRCDLPASLLLDVIDAREVDLAAQAMADDGALRIHLWKSEGALFALAAGILRREPGVDVHATAAACGHAYGLAAAPARPAARAVARAPAAAAIAPGCREREQSGAVVRRRREQYRGYACGLLCRSAQISCHEPATCGEFAAQYAGGLPSFGLGRDVSAGAGKAGPRCTAHSGRDSAAHARVQDCRSALARSHLTPRGRRAGLHSSREQIDADRCRPEHLPRAHAGRDARGRGDGRASDRVAGREPFPVLPRSGRHPGASRDLAQHVGERAQPSGAVGGAGAQRAPSRRMEHLHLRQDLLGRNTQPLRLSRARRLSQSQEPYDPGAAGGPRGRANRRLQLADVAARAGVAGRARRR